MAGWTKVDDEAPSVFTMPLPGRPLKASAGAEGTPLLDQDVDLVCALLDFVSESITSGFRLSHVGDFVESAVAKSQPSPIAIIVASGCRSLSLYPFTHAQVSDDAIGDG